jgi:hypothetical protein
MPRALGGFSGNAARRPLTMKRAQVKVSAPFLRRITLLPEKVDPTRHPFDVAALRGLDLELDLVTHDVKKFFGLLLRRNGYVLEQRRSRDYRMPSP